MMNITIQISEDDEGIAVEGVQAGEAEPVDIEPPTELGEKAPGVPGERGDVEPAPPRFRPDKGAEQIASGAEPAPAQFSPSYR